MPGDAPPTYWSRTRQPWPSLAFILPLMIVYEAAVNRSSNPDAIRAGVDQWIRQALASLGLTDRWLLPLSVVLLLLVWQALSPRSWKFPPGILIGMWIESFALAVALIGLSKLVDLGFAHLEHHAFPRLSGSAWAGESKGVNQLIGFLGAGLYEEAFFRLALIPLLLGIFHLLLTPEVAARTLAVTGSALIFSLAHHVGAPGESFTWFAFIFRWSAGVAFAWIFLVRGFGVAVGAHVLYDLLVGWLPWGP